MTLSEGTTVLLSGTATIRPRLKSTRSKTLGIQIPMSVSITRYLLVVLGSLAIACGDGGGSGSSPTGPTNSDRDLTLREMTVEARGFPDGARVYVLCGGIFPSVGDGSGTVLQSISVTIRDQNGRDLFTWPVPAYPFELIGGLSGCFGSQSDPDNRRAVGTTFRLAVSYSRNGSTQSIAASGPITVRP